MKFSSKPQVRPSLKIVFKTVFALKLVHQRAPRTRDGLFKWECFFRRYETLALWIEGMKQKGRNQVWNQRMKPLKSTTKNMKHKVWNHAWNQGVKPLALRVWSGWFFTPLKNGPINGQGGYSTGIYGRGLWIGFVEVWTRKLVQTLSKTYVGGTRDRF